MSWRTVLTCVALLAGPNAASPRRGWPASQAEVEDLEGSAVTYVYTKQQGLPVYYLQYTDHGSGPRYHATDGARYVAPVAPVVPETAPILLAYGADDSVGNERSHDQHAGYGEKQLAEHEPPIVKSKPRAPYYEVKEQHEGEGTHSVIGQGNQNHQDHQDREDDDGEEENHEDGGDGEKVYGGPDRSDEEFESGGSYGYGSSGGWRDGSHGDGESSHEAGGGMKYGEGRYAERGEKGDKGYESYGKFEKGEKGSHDDTHERGSYSNEGGRKKGHDEESVKHGSHKEAEKSKKGSDYGHSSNYKKGQKTSGFHNVYYKDDYKKETDFYDDEDEKGYFDKFEEFDKGHKAAEGGFKKGGHYSSGHDHGDRGKEGHYDKGHHYSQDQGHKAEEGEQSYYEDHEDYGNKKASKLNKMHKYNKNS